MQTCTYCGEIADTEDHLEPVSRQTTRRRKGKMATCGKRVPCCRLCNSLLGAANVFTIRERAAVLLLAYARRDRTNPLAIAARMWHLVHVAAGFPLPEELEELEAQRRHRLAQQLAEKRAAEEERQAEARAAEERQQREEEQQREAADRRQAEAAEAKRLLRATEARKRRYVRKLKKQVAEEKEKERFLHRRIKEAKAAANAGAKAYRVKPARKTWARVLGGEDLKGPDSKELAGYIADIDGKGVSARAGGKAEVP